jgi:hypothetical protein
MGRPSRAIGCEAPMVIKHVNPVSAGKVGGVLGVLLGVIIGACFSLIGMVAGGAMAANNDRPGGAFLGMFLGIGAIVILPIFYGVFMFIYGLIIAALYNFAAKWTGGLEVDAS